MVVLLEPLHRVECHGGCLGRARTNKLRTRWAMSQIIYISKAFPKDTHPSKCKIEHNQPQAFYPRQGLAHVGNQTLATHRGLVQALPSKKEARRGGAV